MSRIDRIDKEAQVKCSWCSKLVYALLSKYFNGNHYHQECWIERTNKPERVEE